MGIINRNELESLAAALLSPGKGILAADESLPTIEERFSSVQVESTEETRHAFREMLLTTSNLQRFISGVILHDETIRQGLLDGTSFAEKLQRDGIIPGIKVDRGTQPLPGYPNERITEGLDGLQDRLSEYKTLGARFTKWRAVFHVSDSTPSGIAIDVNANALARFAALSQELGMLPIVEPEVLMVGNHSLLRTCHVTADVLRRVFYVLFDHGVKLEQMLLKPNMVVPGLDCSQQAGAEEVARWTLACMRRVVPVAVPGIMFLSGGQSAELATLRLNAINLMGRHPWELSFSFSRALQVPALIAWRGEAANVAAGQKALYERAKCNCAARYGKYSSETEAKK